MLNPFRSALLSSKTFRFAVLGIALSLYSTATANPAWARMDDPVPAPHFEGWPEPHDDHIVDGTQESLSNLRVDGAEALSGPIPQSELEESVQGIESATTATAWVLRILYWSHLLP